MKCTLAFFLYFCLASRSAAYTAATCPSEIPEWERIDCYPEGGSTEAGCVSKGCMWCETSVQGPPWCFYNDATVPTVDCESCSSCSSKVDCYPDSGSNELGCIGRGCLWCPSSIPNEPWCVKQGSTDSTTLSPPASTIEPSTVDPGGEVGCSSCSSCENKIDCFPEAGSSESGCYSRGCLWCPSSNSADPWCVVPDGGVVPTQSPPSSGCATDIPESKRIDCWPGGGSTQSGCIDAGCLWCESSQNGVPWCFFNTTNLPEGIADSERVNCIPEGGFSPDTCTDRGCAFASTESPDAPMCYFQNDKYGYKMVGEASVTANGYRVQLERIQGGSLFGDDVDNLMLDVTFDTSSRLHIKFYDPNNERFEVPLTIDGAEANPTGLLYDIEFYNDPSFYFKVLRRSTGTVLFDTSLGGLTFSNQFLQISTRLPSTNLYGWGEHEHQTLAHKFEWQTMGMYARDQPPDPGANLYGTHPFYISVEDDLNAHGVFFLNAAAQDVQLTPAPGLVYRTIGGVLDMYVFLGPEPNAVVEQYTSAIGTAFMPPYWSLGFQLCRYGYGSIDVVKETVSRMDAYQIPLDVQYGDIDYMDQQRDFTYDTSKYAGLPEYVKQLQADGKHYVIILDPCLTMDDPAGAYPPYDEGSAMNVWVTQSDGVTPLSGKVWPPGRSVFPDFTNPDTELWWSKQCKTFHDDVIGFDGLWIDMNEPANFVTGSSEGCEDNALNQPPYKPKIWGDILADKSVCPDARHKIGTHYDVHNLFGWSQSNQTRYSAIGATGLRPFVISRSTFAGSGKWAAHWLGDNNSDWHDLKMSVIGMLEFNFFGIPFVGADICGFNGNVDEELCQRWMELGAFYPFSRNHNGIGYKEQDPAVWGDQFAERSREVLNVRYTLLPYLYTLFYDAHTKGSGVVRPLAFEFITDKTTHTIDEQFMWGSALLFSPALYQGVSSVDAYLPSARWFDYYTGEEIIGSGGVQSVDAPLGTIPIHVRGGNVVATQEPAVNTVASRRNPFGLIVALDHDGTASGKLYWDEGDTLEPMETGKFAVMHFAAANGKLTTTAEGSQSIMSSTRMGSIRIMGLPQAPSSVKVNGSPAQFTYYNSEVNVSGISAGIDSSFTVEW